MSDTKMHRHELLHSKFIADLLNPQGKHKYRDQYLKLFLKHFEHKLQLDKFSTYDALVDLEYKKIDILIRSGDTAIIIENKIFAKDQNEQIYRYYENMLEEGYKSIKLIYLSPLGKEPEAYSIEKLPEEVKQQDFFLASYDIDIFTWISECQKITPRNDFLIQDNFNQYLGAIEKITGKFESLEYMCSIKELLLLDNNFEHIDTIINARNELIKDFQKDLWNKVGVKIEALCSQKQPYPFSENIDFNHSNNKIEYEFSFNSFRIKLDGFDKVFLDINFDQNSHEIKGEIKCDSDLFSNEYSEISDLVLEASIEKPSITLNEPFSLKTGLGADLTPTQKLILLKNMNLQRSYIEILIVEISEILALLKKKSSTAEEKKGFLPKIFGFFNDEKIPEEA